MPKGCRDCLLSDLAASRSLLISYVLPKEISIKNVTPCDGNSHQSHHLPFEVGTFPVALRNLVKRIQSHGESGREGRGEHLSERAFNKAKAVLELRRDRSVTAVTGSVVHTGLLAKMHHFVWYLGAFSAVHNCRDGVCINLFPSAPLAKRSWAGGVAAPSGEEL